MKRLKKLMSIFTFFALALGLMPAGNVYAITASEVTGFVLIDSSSDSEVRPLVDSSIVRRGCSDPININVKAEVEGSVGSVRFAVNSNSNFRTENAAPYALAGDDTNGDYYNWSVPAGTNQYVITATSWSGSGATGTAGVSKTINIVVTNDCTAPVITGATNGGKYFGPVTVNFSDESVVPTGMISKDGNPAEPFFDGWSVSEVGAYWLSVSDGVNISTVSFEITDESIPVIISPLSGFYQSSGLGNFEWTEVTGTGVTYQIDITAEMPNLDGSFVSSIPSMPSAWTSDTVLSVPVVDEATYWWKARARDVLGNMGHWSDYTSFVIDNTAPVLQDLADVVTGVPVRVEANAADANGVSYKWEMVSGPGLAAFSSDIIHDPVISADTNGDYVIRLTVIDPAGNKTAKEMNFKWLVETVVLTPVVATPETSLVLGVSDYVYDQTKVLGDEPEKDGEVTSDKKEEEKESNEKGLPYFGIFILALLGLIGVYLIYLQRPEWFSWMGFWRKRKATNKK